MSLSFRTRGNFIDFVNIDDTSIHAETVIMSLHNTSKAIDWVYGEDTTRISFTIDEVEYNGILVTDIDFDGTPMNSQDDFETNIEAMFPNLAGGGGALGYLVYTALMNQSGTSAPVATVLENTLSGTVVWTRASAGSYLATLAGAFLTGKVAVFLGPPAGLSIQMIANRNNDNSVYVDTASGEVNGDQLFDNTPIEIRVYP